MEIIEKPANAIQSRKEKMDEINYSFSPSMIIMNSDTWKKFHKEIKKQISSLNVLEYQGATIFIDPAVKDDEFVILGYKTKK